MTVWIRGVVVLVGVGTCAVLLAACRPAVSGLQAIAPVFSLESGTYSSDQVVQLSTETAGAEILFTTNGEDPTVAGTIYSGPIEVAGHDTTLRIRAFARRDGLQPSRVVEAEYSIEYPILTLVAGGSGTVALNGAEVTDPTPVESGADLLITANPEAGVSFVTWNVLSGDESAIEIGDISAPSTSLILTDTNATVRAEFSDIDALPTPQITTAATNGLVTPSPVSFTISRGATGATLQYSLDGGSTWIDYPSSEVTINTDGSYQLTARQVDAEGNTSASATTISFTIDSTAPDPLAAPVLAAEDDTGTSSTDGITRRTSGLTFAGTAEAGTSVELSSNIDGSLGTTTAASNGDWSMDVDLSESTHQITATATDGAGNSTGVSPAITVVVDATSPAQPGAPVLDAADDNGVSDSDGVTSQTTGLTLSGTAEENTALVLESNVDGQLASLTVPSGGNWSTDVSLSVATHTITVTVTDLAGNPPATSSTTVDVRVQPQEPTLLQLNVTGTSIEVNWDDNSDSELGFVLRRREGIAGSWVEITTTPANTTSYTDPGLADETLYYYELKAVNGGVDSGWSNQLNTTTNGWITESVNDLFTGGTAYTSLALRTDGTPAMAYHGTSNLALRYGVREGNQDWDGPGESQNGSPDFVEDGPNGDTPSPDFGKYASLAMDGNTPHIAYFDNTSGSQVPKYTYWNGTDWRGRATTDAPDVVDSSLSVGFTSIALNGSEPHIAYVGADKDLRYVHWDTTNGWVGQQSSSGPDSLETPSTGSITFTSIAIDSAGHPHIAYQLDATVDEVKYVAWNGTSWIAPETIDSVDNPGFGVSLGLDSSDTPHVSYYRSSGSGVLSYAYRDGAVWRGQINGTGPDGILDTDTYATGQTTSIDFDSAGNPTIAFSTNSSNGIGVMFTRWDGSGWVGRSSDSGPDLIGGAEVGIVDTGLYVSHKMDGDTPRLSYQQGSNPGYARWEE